MSEDTDKTSPSDISLGVKRKITVIGGGAPVTPTVITAPIMVRKATVIGGSPPTTAPVVEPAKVVDVPVPAAPRPKPSVITQTAVPQPPAPDVPKYVSHPSVLPGTIRKGVKIEKDDLAKYFPGTPMETIARVQTILSNTIVDLLTDALCVRWGEDEQKRFGVLTEKTLKLVEAQVVKDGTARLNRLYAILQEIAAAFQPKPKGLLDWGTTHVSPRVVFERNQAELSQLRPLLDQKLPEIMDVEGELKSVSAEFEELVPKLDAQSLAAKYLAEKLLDKSAQAQKIETLDGRSVSLMKTVAYIKQGTALRGQQSALLRQLVTRVQDGVCNALPAWIQSVTMLFQKPTQNDTDVYTLRTALDSVLTQLS